MMKNLVTILMVLVGFSGLSQLPTLYPYESIVNEIDTAKSMEDGRYELVMKPKGVSSFEIIQPKWIKGSLDTNKIKEYMFESFNELRKKYGKSPAVKENKELSEYLSNYAKKLKYEYEHSDLKQSPIYGNFCFIGEVMDAGYLLEFYHLKEDDGDINKIIAYEFINGFMLSKPHAKILMTDANDIEVGFGIHIVKGNYFLCFQVCSEKKGN